MDAVESRSVRIIALVALLVLLVGPLALATPRVLPVPLATGVALGTLAVFPPVTDWARRAADGDTGREYPWYYHFGFGVGGAVAGQALAWLLPAGVMLALVWLVVGVLSAVAVGLLVRAGLGQ